MNKLVLLCFVAVTFAAVFSLTEARARRSPIEDGEMNDFEANFQQLSSEEQEQLARYLLSNYGTGTGTGINLLQALFWWKTTTTTISG